ncbi:unnamed protein product [Rhizophagus irregularis]|nr:unnamed protein product [Rhizophagus irregularis]CAB5337358.1 unnamed protein product [Rhizophagus irregularis]
MCSPAGGDQRYCRTFNSGLKYVREKPDGLNKLKFYFKINTTEAEAEELGVALITLDFIPHSIVMSTLAFLFGSPRLDPWGFVRRISIDKWYLLRTFIPQDDDNLLNDEIDLEKYLVIHKNLSKLE